MQQMRRTVRTNVKESQEKLLNFYFISFVASNRFAEFRVVQMKNKSLAVDGRYLRVFYH